MRIVVLGGFGNFGARICRALAGDPDVEIVVAGRNTTAALPEPRLRVAQLDIQSPVFAAQLRALAPDVVIHCAGPFQGQDYRVAEVALAAGAHYLDLADGREFVTRFTEHIDRRAREVGKLAICGASTLPALSSAVVDHLLPLVWGLDEIQMIIAPGQHAPRGIATIAGVLTGAGRQFEWLLDGKWQRAWGWQELREFDLGIGARLAAACDVPDLGLFPLRYPGLRTVQFRAALEVRIQQRALWVIAMLRRAGIPLPIKALARLLGATAPMLDTFGSDRGAMQVSLRGTQADGGRIRIDWNLVAPANHGPEVPCMAAILLARKIHSGALKGAGAHAAMGFLTLAEFESEFARWGITTSVAESIS